jgi:NAD(P)-dependent dehydrogenase (short-subunit alcohol dehydrogenase family)
VVASRPGEDALVDEAMSVGTPIQDATALVTGGFRGFGAAVVDELLHRGAAKVYATSRTYIAHDDPMVVPLVLDVGSDASVAAAAKAAPDVNIVVNNADVTLATPLLSAPLDDILTEFDINTLGIVRMARAFAPILAERPPSNMTNVLSVLSWLAMGRGHELSKAAAWSATSSLRDALRGQGTTVTAVHVGYMETDMTAGLDVAKADPRHVARQVVDAIEAGVPEVLADDTTRWVKAQLSNPVAVRG